MTPADALQPLGPGTVLADTVRLNLPASHKYLHLLGSCIEGFLGQVDSLPNSDELSALAYNVQLAAHEIAANIVEHAYGGSSNRESERFEITLLLETGGTLLVVELHDHGQPFDPSTVPEPILGEPQVHGYGLFLARELMDTVEYASGPRWQRLASDQTPDATTRGSDAMTVTVTEHTTGEPAAGEPVALITVDGRLDAASAPAMREQLNTLDAQGTTRVVVDLTAVTFLDSAGLAVLVTALKRARQASGDVKLVWPTNENTQRILRLTRFDRVFEMHDTAASALGKF